MRQFFAILIMMFSFSFSYSQNTDTWKIDADKIDPSSYYGETVANGVIGIVSSDEPLKYKTVVLNGAYDQYGRGMVSNFLKSFNLVNIEKFCLSCLNNNSVCHILIFHPKRIGWLDKT